MKNIRIVLLLAIVAVALAIGLIRSSGARVQRPPARVAQAPADVGTQNHRTINASTPGQAVDIEKFVVKGKINVFDFYSKFCPPCMRVAPLLEQLAEKDGGVVVNKIDINRPDIEGIDWQSPVARQYELQGIPHFIVYDASGKKIAEGEDATRLVLEMLKKEGLV